MTHEELARSIAEKVFSEKEDKAGRPYIMHLERVAISAPGMARIGDWPKNGLDKESIRAVAWLHDILEDCPDWSGKHIRQLFGDEIANAVSAITKWDGQTYQQYIENVKSNEFARIVKLADLRDNMDISRLPELTEKDIERLKKYHAAFLYLQDK